MLAGSIIIQAIILLGILKLVARREADLNLYKLVLVVCGITAVEAILLLACIEHIGEWTTMVSALATLWIVKQFCWLEWGKAFLVTLIYVGVGLGMSFVIESQVTKATDAVVSKMNNDFDQVEKTFEALEEMHEKMYGDELGPVDSKIPTDRTSASRRQGIPNEVEAPTSQSIVTCKILSRTLDEPRFTEAWRESFAQLYVTGTGKGAKGRHIMIGTELFCEGDSHEVTHNQKKYAWKVLSIKEKVVLWEPLYSEEGPAQPESWWKRAVASFLQTLGLQNDT